MNTFEKLNKSLLYLTTVAYINFLNSTVILQTTTETHCNHHTGAPRAHQNKTDSMATDLNPNTGITLAGDTPLVRNKAIDILLSITATELRLTILEHYLSDFLNNRTPNIRCPLFSILQERSQGLDPILAESTNALRKCLLCLGEDPRSYFPRHWKESRRGIEQNEPC